MEIKGIMERPVKVEDWMKDQIEKTPMLAVQCLRTSCFAVLIPAIRKIIRDENIVFEGGLFQRLDARASTNGEGLWVDVGAIGVPYSLAVEEGQKPGTRQNLDKLIRYARLKLGLPPKKAEAVGAAMLKTIEAKGTKAHPFLFPAWVISKDDLFDDFASRMKTAMGL